MNMNGWGLSFLRARAILILIGSLLVCGGLPVFAASVADDIKAFRAPDAGVRRQAQDDLVAQGPKIVPQLLAALNNRRHLAIVSILQRMGPKVVPALISELKDAPVRVQAGDALIVVITPESRSQVPALLKCLKDPVLTAYCGQALTKVVDDKSTDRVPDLVAALKSRDKGVRLYAAVVLGKIGAGAAAATTALEGAAKDADPKVQQAAAEALKKIRA
jgi:HEAT repeat protein